MSVFRNPSGTLVAVLVNGLGIEDAEVVGIEAVTGDAAEEEDAEFELSADGDQGLNMSCFG